ncbi:MAG: hypothetical protein R6U95_01995 [Bacteroidales bacterium]
MLNHHKHTTRFFRRIFTVLLCVLCLSPYAFSGEESLAYTRTIDTDKTLPDSSSYLAEGDQIGNIIDGVDSAAVTLDFAIDDVSAADVRISGNTLTIESGGKQATVTIEHGEEGTTIKDFDDYVAKFDNGAGRFIIQSKLGEMMKGPNTHAEMNKDNPRTVQGTKKISGCKYTLYELAYSAATKHTAKFLKND